MIQATHNLKDIYAPPKIIKKERHIITKILIQLVIYGLLLLSVPFSFILPMVGFPLGVLLFFNTKRHYAIFPFAGVIYLIVTQIILRYYLILMNT